MATRADRQQRGRERNDRGVDGLKAGAARFTAIVLPHDVTGARSFKELQTKVQANLDAIVQQAEHELNRVGRFIGEDGYPTIDKDQFFSKAKIGSDTP